LAFDACVPSAGSLQGRSAKGAARLGSFSSEARRRKPFRTLLVNGPMGRSKAANLRTAFEVFFPDVMLLPLRLQKASADPILHSTQISKRFSENLAFV
jgi:hypothetical protein